MILWIFSGDPAQALGNGVLAAVVFSVTFFFASLVARDHPWRAFWVANAALVLILGVPEFLGLQHTGATRFGGAHLSAGGHLTAAGFASLALDLGVLSLSNFAGFYLSRFFIRRFNL